jgi:hypothetical protein
MALGVAGVAPVAKAQAQGRVQSVPKQPEREISQSQSTPKLPFHRRNSRATLIFSARGRVFRANAGRTNLAATPPQQQLHTTNVSTSGRQRAVNEQTGPPSDLLSPYPFRTPRPTTPSEIVRAAPLPPATSKHSIAAAEVPTALLFAHSVHSFPHAAHLHKLPPPPPPPSFFSVYGVCIPGRSNLPTSQHILTCTVVPQTLERVIGSCESHFTSLLP